jgi:hypothetical protein
MISLYITDNNFVNQIDEGNRFPHQICVSHHRVHPITYMCTTVTHYCFTLNGLIRYDNLALSPLLLQRGLRIGPIQRNGAN